MMLKPAIVIHFPFSLNQTRLIGREDMKRENDASD